MRKAYSTQFSDDAGSREGTVRLSAGSYTFLAWFLIMEDMALRPPLA